MRPILIILTVLILALTSCEGFVRMQGHVMDNTTKQPIENVKVLLVLKGRDTLINNKLYYDTLEYKERLALRKQKVKDDYKMHSAKGFSKFGPSQTDRAGYFSVGTILVGCVPKCPTCQLLFIKDGYDTVSVKLNAIVQDSMAITLQKIPGNSINSKQQ